MKKTSLPHGSRGKSIKEWDDLGTPWCWFVYSGSMYQRIYNVAGSGLRQVITTRYKVQRSRYQAQMLTPSTEPDKGTELYRFSYHPQNLTWMQLSDIIGNSHLHSNLSWFNENDKSNYSIFKNHDKSQASHNQSRNSCALQLYSWKTIPTSACKLLCIVRAQLLCQITHTFLTQMPPLFWKKEMKKLFSKMLLPNSKKSKTWNSCSNPSNFYPVL